MKRKMSRQLKTDLVGYSFILPNIIGVLLFTLIPMVFTRRAWETGHLLEFRTLSICGRMSGLSVL